MFRPPFWQFNGHMQTIYPSLFRKVKVHYTRERITLPDGDFLTLDWISNNSRKLVIVTHGLEGDSGRHYVTGMIRKFTENGYDGLGWNCRSCGGEINLLPRFYHHGDAEDLRYVVQYAIDKNKYEEVVLVGFSMGGSLTLRLAAEKPDLLPKEVKKVVTASVPLDLPTSVVELNKPGKRFYMERFLKKLGKKIEIKSSMFPNHPILNVEGYSKIKNFDEFDTRYTAPLHGYVDAKDFYAKASVKPILKNIRIPALIVQSANDPFLSPPCLNLGDAESNSNLKLVILKEGGHVGFMQHDSEETITEQLALRFSEGEIK
ncbi:alpha/beta fold hydrolase [Emticicia sp. CRIBPO]|uniref:YheT family hydrolase n=1 Tax=Emticicia sp. CRIBPO TaxID=2683258 RepID=UPI001412A142|nr:alpha/beta fold hydrolase [Emticicia sp. CRIBPO]NBA88577.1 alpha/beta fold hydrolase [Emticicia sp. CRIBPO]